MDTMLRFDRTVDITDVLPSSAWLGRVADWIATSAGPDARDIARDVKGVARRLHPAAAEGPRSPHARWVQRLAWWVAADPRPEARRIAEQLQQWAGNLQRVEEQSV
ncbi:MAG TPA: hypothetical protein VM307_04780 [Egibacteraceae bacterium]|nr:hypothetical protein [Egibacteraceae bacterium]